jgi:CSLREA domain-containing protein
MLRKPGLLLIAILFAYSLLIPGTARAGTTINVTTDHDELNSDGDCSLREAVRAANLDLAVDACPAGSGDDTIVLPAGTYMLSIPGQNEIESKTGDLNITGDQGLAIQGAGADKTIIDGGGIDRVFMIGSQSADVSISGVTIQHGELPSGNGGGGILNWGSLFLDHIVIRDNLVHGTASDDVGGGICNGCGPGTGTVTMIDSTVTENSAERGGGIFSNSVMTITKSAIIGNTAMAGGGLINYGSMTLTNCTLNGNSGSNNGGAILQDAGDLTLTNCTVAGNNSPIGGGISFIAGAVTMYNNIMANSPDANCIDAVNPSGNHNLEDQDTCGFTASGDQVNTDPLLAPLADNGGPTLTQALLPGSPAIDAGASGKCPSVDQRGEPRPSGSACDLGAFEATLYNLYLPIVLKAH